MILHLGGDVAVRSDDIVAVIDLTGEQSALTGEMLEQVRRQRRILIRQGIDPKCAVICAGAKRPGGVSENARVYLSAISSGTLCSRMVRESLR